MKLTDHHDRQRAMEDIDDFLTRYADHAKAVEVRGYRDQLLLEDCERTMTIRRGKIKEDVPEEEKIAWAALDDEDAGKLAQAKRNWEDLAKHKDAEDGKLRPWGLLGQKYLNDIAKVEGLHDELKTRVDRAAEAKGPPAGADRYESMALEAVWTEKQSQPAKARLIWEDLKASARDNDERRWYLLAAWHYRELAGK